MQARYRTDVMVEGAASELLAAGREAILEAAFRTGDYEEGDRLLKAALDRSEADGDRAVEAAAVDQLAWSMHFQALDRNREGADPDAEEALFRRALATWRELGDQGGVAAALFGVGLVHQVLRGDWRAATPFFMEALSLAEDHANDLVRSEVHRHVGFYYLAEEEDHERALHHLRTSQELRERWGDERWVPSGLFVLGMAEVSAGHREQGIEHLRQSVERGREARLSERRVAASEEWLRRAEAGETPSLRG